MRVYSEGVCYWVTGEWASVALGLPVNSLSRPFSSKHSHHDVLLHHRPETMETTDHSLKLPKLAYGVLDSRSLSSQVFCDSGGTMTNIVSLTQRTHAYVTLGRAAQCLLSSSCTGSSPRTGRN